MTFEEWWERRGMEAVHMSWTEDACRFAWQSAIEVAAQAASDHDRAGREWVPGSLWDAITQESAQRIRALAATNKEGA